LFCQSHHATAATSEAGKRGTADPWRPGAPWRAPAGVLRWRRTSRRGNPAARGMICNWKQERASNAPDDGFEDFVRWLHEHNFQSLTEQIRTSSELQQGLQVLLRQDAAQLSQKLDLISQSLSAMSERIESLAPLSRLLKGSQEGLSNQAVEILKVFVDSQARKLTLFEKAGQVMVFERR
jgi:hypothetical protein